MDKISKTYLEIINKTPENNIISEEYHRSPIFGWNKNYFSKIMVKMLQHSIKKFAAKEFDNYFLSSNLFSFKTLFKQTPEVHTSGDGNKFQCTLRYNLEKLSQEETELFLFGNSKERGKIAKFFGLDKNDRGILWNEAFLNKFEEKGLIKKESDGAEEGSEEEEEEEFEELEDNENTTGEDVLINTYLNSIIYEESTRSNT